MNRVEELLIVIFQFLFETVLEALTYWPFESATDRMFGRPANDEGVYFPLLVAAIAAGVVGAISLVVWPHTWLRSPELRIANLVVAPLISAGSAWLFARRRTKESPREHVWFACTFTTIFVLVRFTWGAH